MGLPTYSELLDRPEPFKGTAWRLWGDDDQLGTLNHLTPEVVLQAKESIESGEVIPLNLSLSEFSPPLISHRGEVQHEVFGLNDFHRDDRLDNFFPQASTQIDGLRHFGHPDHGFYNQAPSEELRAGTGLLGIQAVAQRGIVGRGLLLDMKQYRDAISRPLDQRSNDLITVDDLAGALEYQGSELRDGDILLLRTGWLEFMRQVDRRELGTRLSSPGLAQTESVAEWLWNHRISLAAADNIALEAWPAPANSEVQTDAEETGALERSSHTGMLHRILIPLLGMSIGELWDLDALAARCRERRRFDCFITAQPLNMNGGVASPANAVAIL